MYSQRRVRCRVLVTFRVEPAEAPPGLDASRHLGGAHPRRRPRRRGTLVGSEIETAVPLKTWWSTGPRTVHTGRRLADRTKLPAAGGLGQSLPDLPRSGLSAPGAMKDSAVGGDIFVFFALLPGVIWLTNSFLSRPAWAPANGLGSIAATTSHLTKLSMLSLVLLVPPNCIIIVSALIC